MNVSRSDDALSPGSTSSATDTVLIAEDDPIFRHILENWLRKWNYRVTALENGSDAWSVLQQESAPQMVILDWMMPGLDGVELCRRVRSLEQTTHKPARGAYRYVLLLTAKGGKEDIVAGLDAGADDYLTKPFDVNELRARVRAGKRILDLQDALGKVHTELQFEAAHDRLTGLWNRGAIMDLLHRETQRSARIGQSVGVIMADVDHFKQINDTHGHPTGDAVLREVAHRLVEVVRNYDYVGRYGGEEFLIVLAECLSSDLGVMAERMRFCICEKPVSTDSGPISVTISIGLAVQSPAGAEPPKEDELVKAADTALYCAKTNGRNGVEMAPGIGQASSAVAGALI